MVWLNGRSSEPLCGSGVKNGKVTFASVQVIVGALGPSRSCDVVSWDISIICVLCLLEV